MKTIILNWKYLLGCTLLVLFIFSCGPAKKGSTSADKVAKQKKTKLANQIKVAAYNVEFSKNATAEEIGQALKPYDFDIVCFAEAPDGDWTKNVGLAMGLSHVVIGKYPTAAHKDKYKSILSKTPLYDFEEIWMMDRMHTVTKAKTLIDGREVAIYSLHFPFGIGAGAKMEHFANYLKGVQADEISLALGDYNFTTSSPDYKMFTDAGLRPSWVDLGIDVSRLDTWNAIDRSKIEGVIDHIMYNPSKVAALEGQIIEMKKPLSDHKPVWALLEIK
jgi:endonuclease/exonuclease/phosphatase family metal-dependent hydrolase